MQHDEQQADPPGRHDRQAARGWAVSPTQLATFVGIYMAASQHYTPPMNGVEMAPAFDDGKSRAIRVLERRIEQVRAMQLSDYLREVCPQQEQDA